MPYYRECPYCHCHLDPGELCDCKKETQDAPQEARRMRFARPRPAFPPMSGRGRPPTPPATAGPFRTSTRPMTERR